MAQDTPYDLAYQLIPDILSQHDIILSVNSGSGSISEARVEKDYLLELKRNGQQ